MKVQRREAIDILTRDGETALLIDRTLLRISELSRAIYDLTADTVNVGHLAVELESRFGAPVGLTSSQATEVAVEELIRHGVLEAVQAADSTAHA